MENPATHLNRPLGDHIGAGDVVTQPVRVISDANTRHASLWWCSINVIAALACTTLGWDHAPRSVTVVWLLFASLNAVLYCLILRNFPYRFLQIDPHANNTHIAMAVMFGIILGACGIIFAPMLSHAVLLVVIAINVFVATAAIPVFALHRGAYPVFITLFAPLAAAGFSRSSDLNHVELYAAVGFIVALLFATNCTKCIRSVVNTITSFMCIGEPDDPSTSSDLSLLFERRIRVLKRFAREHSRASATLDAIGEAIITTNERNLIDYMNSVAEVLTGIQFREAHGQKIENVVTMTSLGGENLLGGLVEQCLTGAHVQSNGDRTVLKRHDGVEYEVEYQLYAIKNDRGNFTGTTCLIRDVTTKRNLIKNVAWRSTHDPLTNLINRTEFEDRIKKLLSANMDADQKRHALCVIDFDQFKFINETHGVEGGNHVLKSIAVELKQKIRGADTLARIGEDKFGVLLYACPRDKARLIAEGLRRIVEDFQADWHGKDLSISVSIGVVGINPAEDDLSDVLSNAEAACDCAKKDSGNRVHTFGHGEESQLHHSESIKHVREVQAAIQTGRFELYFQHIHPIRGEDHHPRTCEVLLRMHDGAGEVLSPRDFLLTAERYQLMPDIDRWVTKAAIDALRLNHPALNEMETVCINISGQSINDDRFLEFIVNLLDDDIDNHRICCDISEASLISSVDRAQFFIATLKELDCRIALDDFCLGTSSFELFKRLQVDYLKINANFVRNMAYNSVDYEIVLALSRIAKTLRVKTIAEGVTTLATKNSLLGMGVDYVQGLLIDQPRPVLNRDKIAH